MGFTRCSGNANLSIAKTLAPRAPDLTRRRWNYSTAAARRLLARGKDRGILELVCTYGFLNGRNDGESGREPLLASSLPAGCNRGRPCPRRMLDAAGLTAVQNRPTLHRRGRGVSQISQGARYV